MESYKERKKWHENRKYYILLSLYSLLLHLFSFLLLLFIIFFHTSFSNISIDYKKYITIYFLKITPNLILCFFDIFTSSSVLNILLLLLIIFLQTKEITGLLKNASYVYNSNIMNLIRIFVPMNEKYIINILILNLVYNTVFLLLIRIFRSHKHRILFLYLYFSLLLKPLYNNEIYCYIVLFIFRIFLYKIIKIKKHINIYNVLLLIYLTTVTEIVISCLHLCFSLTNIEMLNIRSVSANIFNR
ncbi:hypothetical protein CWI38_0199p0040 [Hamiltosporidium tvaerminnensis]|uniref:Uncharacterized protein n=1 Tax=Hamiltosporidium tvaerminnensis TaxID=1176355 RepID=A0A4Q9M2L8_9MICR|nr:hypothetical protein CWI38_0199p0040 [Hamiltosporidium tvaerminnensis]